MANISEFTPALMVLYSFRRLGNDVEARVTASHPNITTNEMSLLVNLSEPKPMKDLAEIMSCHPSNMTPLVKKCEKNGWVQKKRSKEDSRIIHVQLSVAGRKLRKEILTEINQHVLDVSGMSQQKFEAILKVMHNFN